jgi:hypothetical protein
MGQATWLRRYPVECLHKTYKTWRLEFAAGRDLLVPAHYSPNTINPAREERAMTKKTTKKAAKAKTPAKAEPKKVVAAAAAKEPTKAARAAGQGSPPLRLEGRRESGEAGQAATGAGLFCGDPPELSAEAGKRHGAGHGGRREGAVEAHLPDL